MTSRKVWQLRSQLGPIVGFWSPADSAIDSRQEGQIVRPANGLRDFLPEYDA